MKRKRNCPCLANTEYTLFSMWLARPVSARPVLARSSAVIHCTVFCLSSAEMLGSIHSLPRLLMLGRRNERLF